jgi:pyridoxamine 5'-phosphate oxidase-like protein
MANWSDRLYNDSCRCSGRSAYDTFAARDALGQTGANLRGDRMATIEGACREVCDTTEFVTIITRGEDGPHVVAQWGGKYLFILGDDQDIIAFPVGKYKNTEQNLRKDGRIQLLLASMKVQGTKSPGQGYLIEGSGEIVSSGEIADTVRAKFPWARGALAVHVHSITAQL